MADDDNKTDEGEEKPKSGKGKLILFIIIGVALIGLSIGGTLLAVKLLTPEPEPEVVLDEDGNPIDPEAALEEVVKSPAIYFPVKPPLIVNYQARGRQRFLQAEISLMSRDPEVIAAVELHMPRIRNSLILLFSGQVYEEMQTDEGRELLRQDVLLEIQNIMEEEIGNPGVERVLFTNLVMQ